MCSLDRAVSIALRRLPRERMEGKLDKTGRVTNAPQSLVVKKYDPDVCLVQYPGNFSHSALALLSVAEHKSESRSARFSISILYVGSD